MYTKSPIAFRDILTGSYPITKQQPTTSETSKQSKSDVKCEICGDSGVIFYENNGFEYSKRCECWLRKRALSIWSRSGFVNTNLSIPIMNCSESYVNHFDEIRKSPQNWMLFSGVTGCGKTTQASLIAYKLIYRPSPVLTRIISFFDIIRQMSGMWNSYRQNDLDELIERYFSCSVVVLDDFLKGTKRERGCDYEAACFLIDYLYRLKKPTILTSEFSIEKIAQFDPAMAGRITEMCNGRMIKFKNTINYRLQNK